MQRRAAEESLTDHGKDNSNGRAHVGDAIRHKPGILGFLRQIGFMGATRLSHRGRCRSSARPCRASSAHRPPGGSRCKRCAAASRSAPAQIRSSPSPEISHALALPSSAQPIDAPYGVALDVNAVRRHQRNQRLAQTARRLRPEISHAPLPSHESATHRRPILWSQETINDAAAETRPRRPPTSSSRGQERGTWVVTKK